MRQHGILYFSGDDFTQIAEKINTWLRSDDSIEIKCMTTRQDMHGGNAGEVEVMVYYTAHEV